MTVPNIDPSMREPSSCSFEFARLLVTHNPDMVAMRDEHLNTPLLLAAVAGSRSTVELMLDNGAYVDAVNNKGNSALHIACKMKYFPLLALLLERDAYLELWDDGVRRFITLIVASVCRCPCLGFIVAHVFTSLPCACLCVAPRRLSRVSVRCTLCVARAGCWG